jgi:hypothetical protein
MSSGTGPSFQAVERAPRISHSGQIQSSLATAWGRRAPEGPGGGVNMSGGQTRTQPGWNPRSQESHTIVPPRISGWPQDAQGRRVSPARLARERRQRRHRQRRIRKQPGAQVARGSEGNSARARQRVEPRRHLERLPLALQLLADRSRRRRQGRHQRSRLRRRQGRDGWSGLPRR